MYYLLGNTRFDWGDVTFVPPNDDYWSYCTTEPLPENTKVKMHVTSPITRKVHADYIIANRGPLCSFELKTVLEKSCSGVRFYDAEIFDKKGRKVEKPYFFLHINKIIPCLDFSNSIYKASPDFDVNRPAFSEVMCIDKFTFDANLINGADIFYVSNSPFSSTPVVIEQIAIEIDACKFDGISPVPVDELRWKDRTLSRKYASSECDRSAGIIAMRSVQLWS